MAKFCSNCGAGMEDGDLVCGQCGTPAKGVNPADSQIKPYGKNLQTLSNSLNNRKLVGVVVAAVVAIIILVNVVGFITKSLGYDPVIVKMVKAIKDDDVSKLVSISSQIGQSIYGEDEYETMLESFLDSKLDYYEDKVDGSIKNITYEVKNKSELTGRKVEKIKDTLSDMYDVDADGISKVVKVDLKLTIKGSKEKTKDKWDDLVLLKENGKWKIYIDYYGLFD